MPCHDYPVTGAVSFIAATKNDAVPGCNPQLPLGISTLKRVFQKLTDDWHTRDTTGVDGVRIIPLDFRHFLFQSRTATADDGTGAANCETTEEHKPYSHL